LTSCHVLPLSFAEVSEEGLNLTAKRAGILQSQSQTSHAGNPSHLGW
jgi:hypothetical protein